MSKALSEEFVRRLRLLQEERGINSSQLAKAVGLSHVGIGNFLDGQLPKSEHLLALANFFNVTTDWLLGLDDKLPASLNHRLAKPLLDVAIVELEAVKAKVQSLDRALHRLKTHGR